MEDFMDISEIINQINSCFIDKLSGCRIEQAGNNKKAIFDYNENFDLDKDVGEVRTIVEENSDGNPFNLTFDYEDMFFTIVNK